MQNKRSAFPHSLMPLLISPPSFLGILSPLLIPSPTSPPTINPLPPLLFPSLLHLPNFPYVPFFLNNFPQLTYTPNLPYLFNHHLPLAPPPHPSTYLDA